MESKIEQFEADIDYAKLDIQDLKNEIGSLKKEILRLQCDAIKHDREIRFNFNVLLTAIFVTGIGMAWVTVDSINSISAQIVSVINALIELK